jgi:hAT family C-terminal dimerisation region
MEIDPPELPRQRKLPLRIAGSSPSHVWKYAIEYYRSYYFQFVDVTIGVLQRRYDQPGLCKYMLLENVLLQSMPRNEIHDIQIIKEYSDINVDALATQLDMYRQQGWKCQSIDDFTQQLRNMEGATRNLFSDVERLLRLLLTVSCSNAEAERSFSCLRRLKTYLRSTMGQDRLNNIALLHVHQQKLDSLDIVEVAKEFIDKLNTRRDTFGKF